jgi:hypothetical protein
MLYLPYGIQVDIPVVYLLIQQAFENKTHSTKDKNREYNPQTETHVRIERTYIFSNISKKRRQQFPRQKF